MKSVDGDTHTVYASDESTYKKSVMYLVNSLALHASTKFPSIHHVIDHFM